MLRPFPGSMDMAGGGFIAVGVGAALGAWLRWWLGIAFNAVTPNLPLGTLAANLIGGYLGGGAVEDFFQPGGNPLGRRLFVITRFLGGPKAFFFFFSAAVGPLLRNR